VSLLTSAGYNLIQHDGGTDIVIDTAAHLPKTKDLPSRNYIHCDLADIADTIYQA